MTNMSETEIMNFVYNFSNLIREKDCEILALITENKRLTATVIQLAEPSRRLTEKEVRDAERPVYCILIPPYSRRTERGFWAIPASDMTGVVTPRKSVYPYENYEKTWYALSMETTSPEGAENEY